MFCLDVEKQQWAERHGTRMWMDLPLTLVRTDNLYIILHISHFIILQEI